MQTALPPVPSRRQAQGRALLRGIGLLGGGFLGIVLLVASWAKLIDPDAFVELIHQEGLDGLLPARVVAFIALALEVGLGLTLVLGIRRRWNLVPSTVLVLFFVFLTGRTYLLFLQGKADPARGCGCFGNLVERTPSQAFWQDVLLLVPGLALAWLGRQRLRDFAPWRRIFACGVITAGALVFATFAADLPLDDLATRLHTGSSTKEVCTGEGKSRICLADVVPLLADGRHVVVLADLEDTLFRAKVADYNQYALDGKGPTLWVLTASPHEAVQRFALLAGAIFHVQEAPASLLRPLYRRLPRSFLVEDGVIVATYAGEPPWGSLPPPVGG